MYDHFLKYLEERSKSIEFLRSLKPDVSVITERMWYRYFEGCDIIQFSPHPDDECIVGGLALRMKNECQSIIFNIAVTLGSDFFRKEGRKNELHNACDYLGWFREILRERGLITFDRECEVYKGALEDVIRILKFNEPKIVIFPHKDDVHPTHIGTHNLIMDAIKAMPDRISFYLIQTECWGQMKEPNLMLELSNEHVATLMTALSFHEGEVSRSPYHLRLPDWMSDNVQRSEFVGGFGCPSPDFKFACNYRVDKLQNGKIVPAFEKGMFIGANDDLSDVFIK